jgi:hypothetical protein
VVKARAFAELSDAELRLLARQEGFTGRLAVTGARGALRAAWRHEIRFQPLPPGITADEVDRARVEPHGGAGMLEYALDGSWTEHWRRITDGDERVVEVRVTRGGRLEQVLLVAGDHFLYARNRARDLPAARSLVALIDSVRPTRALLTQWLDLELSAGRIRGGASDWRIEHSTLPWREGERLAFAARVVADPKSGALSGRAAAGERWTITARGLPTPDAVVLFPRQP